MNTQLPPESEPSEAVCVSGRVKWFDFDKGFGFITPSDGGPDVLLHRNCVRESGNELVREGTTICCEVVRGPRGLQAKRILFLDKTTAVPVTPLVSLVTHIVASPDGEPFDVMVKWFNRARGYGFVSRHPWSNDIFVHVEVLRKYGIEDVQTGQHLTVRTGDGPKGEMVAEILPEAAKE